jgi:osmotically-inducible protein OsmY
MRSDTDIKRDVEAELRFRPDIDERDIAVKVTNAVVALTGFTRTYLDKQRAEDAAKRVLGVAGVANDIEVRLAIGDGLADPEIARTAVQAIRSSLPAVGEKIKVLVQHGQVTLEGEVEWFYLKEEVERTVRGLRGVTGVVNSISILPKVKPGEIKQRIGEAFRRSAQIDADRIIIDTRDGEVTLHGRVRSWPEREEAEHTAWSAQGVSRVKNEITVGLS